MVLTLQFDKNLLRYITLNLQRLFRTVLVWHFKLESNCWNSEKNLSVVFLAQMLST